MCKWYYKTGQVSSEEIYRKGNLISYTFYNKDGKKTKEGKNSKSLSIYEKAEFKGGVDSLLAYISRETKYPEEAKKDNIIGRVMVQFIIGKDGDIEDVKILNSVHKLLDDEAFRVISTMPEWKPGRNHNLPIRLSFAIPINFKTY